MIEPMIFNQSCTFEDIENNKKATTAISKETIKRAKAFAALIDPNIKYSVIPRMSGVITFEWKSLDSNSSDVEGIRRQRVDITDHGMDIHTKATIITGNLGSHDIKFSI
jgi:hypothetical protein